MTASSPAVDEYLAQLPADQRALYPMSGATVAAHRDELVGYDTSPGTIRFPASRPLPAALVRRLVAARIRENAGLRATRRRRAGLASRERPPTTIPTSRP